jgi:DNA modification methylase
MISLAESKVECRNFDLQIEEMLLSYNQCKEPIEVSFRDLVDNLDKPDRATHLIHPYPAKLLMHIPHFFLNNNIFSKEGDLILDPFSGSGTVLLEGILANRNAIGADANPLARLISKVKVQSYNTTQLIKFRDQILGDLVTDSDMSFPRVPNINFWFLPHVQNQLNRLVNVIGKIDDEKYRDFYLVCFSNCIKKVSLADPRVSVPVKLNADRYSKTHPFYHEAVRKLDSLVNINVYERFEEIVNSNILKAETFNTTFTDKYSACVVSNDARKLTKELNGEKFLEDESVSLIISSPPYAGAQKYIRASSLSLGWLNYIQSNTALKELDDNNIGRENYRKSDYSIFKPTGIKDADVLLEEIFKINPLRAHIAGNYLNEMRSALKESIRVLKPGGYFVLVVANNQVCGKEFRTQEYLLSIIESLGLKIVLRLIDDIKSYGLMTKRNKTASIITREWVLVFRK